MKGNSLVIKTPEGIVFSLSLAGPVSRFFAWFIDFLAITVIGSAIASALRFVNLISADAAAAAMTVGYFGISIGYGIVLEWLWRGQTVGKKLLRLRVADAGSRRLQFDQIVTRNLLRSVDMLPAFYFIGGVSCWFTSKCQRLGDLAANTIVIRTPQVVEPDLDQLIAGKFNSLRSYPHLVARLRQRVSPTEAATALQALVRRDEFEPNARVHLFEQLAGHFRTKVDFPTDAIDGVADEQYIRNVVDVLYRSTPGRPNC